ncbi:MAG TPA: Gfo/Idh/MocA family oxidoreductase [Armatimonadota bacterium]|nr:Gfo/Idh/MocA family oxidoreductase [Armatimonadota bacterium]
MSEIVKVGCIGCGGNARGHIGRVLGIPEAKIVGVCDVVEDLSRAAANDTGASFYTDHRALLDRGDLDAVYISVPVFAHGAPEFDAIERGIPFLVEKPVALEMAMAQEIAARVEKRGLITAVGYQLRYAGTVDRARELLAGKRVGLVVGKYWCDSGAGDPSRWVRQMSRSGGQLVEQATHTIDMMRYLVGEIEEVFCVSVSRVLDQIDCPDFNAITLKFKNGAAGSLTTSWASSIGWSNANVLDILYENALLNWTYGKLTVQSDGAVEETSPNVGDIDRVFIDAVQRGDAAGIRSPYSDAVISLAVSLAMNQSAREGRPTRIDTVLGVSQGN